MNHELLENSIEVASLFLNDELTEDEVYSLFYQGMADEELFVEAMEVMLESDENLEEGVVDVIKSSAKLGSKAVKGIINAPEKMRNWHNEAMETGNRSLKNFDKLLNAKNKYSTNFNRLKSLNEKPVHELSPDDLDQAKSAYFKMSKAKNVYNNMIKNAPFDSNKAFYAKSVNKLNSAKDKLSGLKQNIKNKYQSVKDIADVLRNKQ